ncbi:MAG: hypothetical protein WAV38_40420 [Xanthobacteraceae bacterium]
MSGLFLDRDMLVAKLPPGWTFVASTAREAVAPKDERGEDGMPFGF